MTISQYTVSGMTCGGCVARVQATLAKYADNVEVTLNPPQAKLINSQQGLDALNQALSAVGHYQLSPVTPVNSKVDSKPVQDSTATYEAPKSWLATYFPLLLIFGFILLVTVSIQLKHMQAGAPFVAAEWMMHFMAGFFLIFSFFKLLDIRSFASSYAMYDLLAMRSKTYGYIYPFIELGLGVSYLLAWQLTLTNWLTFVVMTFSSLGVIRSVLNKQKIRCACLGAVFNLPMSTVTIIEDLLMAGMALFMLI